jgi:dehydrogenase/reductase SDR family protein 7B
VRQSCRKPDDVRIIPFDLSGLDALPGHAAQALACWDRVDFMVHNAGVALREPVVTTPLHLDQQVMATNYFGAVALTKALLPSMIHRRSGHFVVISSLSGKYGVPRLAAYAATKHALHGFFESLRAEVHDDNVRVTIVVPGIVRTAVLRHALTGSGAAYGRSLPDYDEGLDPDVCAARILRAVARGAEEVAVGGSELATLYLKRFFPGLMSILVRNHPARMRRRLLRMLTFGFAGAPRP